MPIKMMKSIETLLEKHAEGYKEHLDQHKELLNQNIEKMLKKHLPKYLDKYFEEHKTYLETKLAEHHEEIQERLGPKQEKRAEENWKHATESEKILMGNLLFSFITHGNLGTLLRGGHFVFKDGGELYRKWVNNDRIKKTRRISSHHSLDQQYGVEGPFVKEALFGTTEIDGQKCTWIQLERYPAEGEGLWLLLKHLGAWIEYEITGKNIGPYGESKNTEKRPEIIDKEKGEEELRRQVKGKRVEEPRTEIPQPQEA